jgi:hypothetical protein
MLVLVEQTIVSLSEPRKLVAAPAHCYAAARLDKINEVAPVEAGGA